MYFYKYIFPQGFPKISQMAFYQMLIWGEGETSSEVLKL